jgi:uncharacterized protein (TIGR01777 family)
MNILISGSNGLIGKRLVSLLNQGGHAVVRLVRKEPATGDRRFWNPDAGTLDPAVFDGIDGVVHLGGVNIAEARWSEKQKARLRDSRVNSTSLLASTMASLDHKPSVFVSASAIGYYGERGDEELFEESPPGEGFLPELCQAWEEATLPAANADIRVVDLRLGMVIDRQEGALSKMLMPFKMGLGGVMGSGQQYWSWISLEDAARAIEFALTNEELRGPVNGVSPQPVTNREYTKSLGKALHRPTIFPMPAFAARLAFGEMADGLMLCSARVIPSRLTAAGFEFRHPTLDAAFADIL